MSQDTAAILGVIGIFLGMGTVATAVATGWYVLAQKDRLDWNAVSVFAKVFFGMSGAGILVCLILKYYR